MRLDLVGDELNQIDSIWGRIRHGEKPAATLETSSAKFSATTNFLFSFSSLYTLNKGIFHDITISNDNNRKPYVESTRAMTREHGSQAESKNCEILLFPTADRRFHAKVKCWGFILGQIPQCTELNTSQISGDCPGGGGGGGYERFWN